MELYYYYYCYILHYFLGQEWPIVAVATIKTPEGLLGNVTFEQSTCTDPVKITAIIEGLTGCHGFHIHELGDLTDGCTSLKAHWNPSKEKHGKHAGDLPELCVKNKNEPVVLKTEKQVVLAGPQSIVGRSVVVHANPDDMGRLGTEISQTTGSSGPRIGCGVIGLRSPTLSTTTVDECYHAYHL